jgi:hypothetical protein
VSPHSPHNLVRHFHGVVQVGGHAFLPFLSRSHHHSGDIVATVWAIVSRSNPASFIWQLMYLSTSTLAYNQITKIEGAVDNFQPKIDKLGLIKSLLGSGVVSALDFDAIAYQMQLCLLRP